MQEDWPDPDPTEPVSTDELLSEMRGLNAKLDLLLENVKELTWVVGIAGALILWKLW